MSFEREREQLAENLLTFVPTLFKRLIKKVPGFCGMSRQQFELLFRIVNNNSKPMSFYSEEMHISKPNLTVMTDKLIEDGLIERGFDANDRRVIILSITQKGTDFLNSHKIEMREGMLDRLTSFTDSDVVKLNYLINEIHQILDRIDQKD